MRMTRLPLAAALLLSTVALAQAQQGTEPPTNPQAAHSGASNHMGNQPPGTMEGSGGTPTGISNGENPGNRGTGGGMGMMHPTAMTMHHPMRHKKMMKRHHHMAMTHHAMRDGNAMHANNGAMHATNDAMNPTNGGANDVTHSNNGAMTGGNPTGRDDSNRGSAPDGGTNGVTPH